MKKNDTNRKRINLLEFAGERERPESSEKIAAKRPILAKKEPPKELLALNRQNSIYVTTSNRKEKPTIDIKEIGEQGARTLWKIDIKENDKTRIAAQLGQSAERHPPEYYVQNVDPGISFTGHCPEWMDTLFTPPVIQETPKYMRRFNGRSVRPNLVFGSDGRQIHSNFSYPWRCVGKIFTSDNREGSAALIANNAIVTAAHLVPSGAWLGLPWSVEFVASYFDGTGVSSFCSHIRSTEPVTESPTGYDWAVMKLFTPLGDTLGWFGYNGYSSDWEDEPFWTIVGYPGAIAGGERPSWQTGIRILDDDSDDYGGRELEHKGDTSDGNSGGPMFSWWNNDPRLIGVVSGSETDYGFPASFETLNVSAGGSGFTNLCRWARQNW
jgi:V8-like Glu-specific endopeptidase